MDQQILQQVGIGGVALAIGVSGWLLPFRWNLLRLRRTYARFVSDNVNQMLPKIVGTILAVVGLAILIGTAVVGKFK
jgi:hypothetical protein